MGFKTYSQIVSILSYDTRVYEDLMSYVFTHQAISSTYNIHFINEDVCKFIENPKKEEDKDIWICDRVHIIH